MKTSTRIVHWVPRVLCIMAILFISLFALDSFSSERTLWQNLLGFVIHLIPSAVLTLFLIIAWKWELSGGIIFVLLGIAATPYIYSRNFHQNQSVGTSIEIIIAVTLPFIIVGVLFIVSHYLKRRDARQFNNY
jgi:hypothetical protein